jgi:hypothetical protein
LIPGPLIIINGSIVQPSPDIVSTIATCSESNVSLVSERC